jgi:thioredoxin 2
MPSPSEPIDVPDAATFEALIARSGLPVLVDFWAPWCGPCKMVAPEIAKVAAEGSGRWIVTKLDTEQLSEPAGQHQVRAIPLMVVFNRGREVARQAGAMPASGIRQFLQQHV